MRRMLRSAAKSSRLASNLVPPFDSPMDRQFAASPHVTFMRLRMQQVARLLAEGLAGRLSAADPRPLVLANGSVTRDDETRARLVGASRFDVVPRGVGRFTPLAARAGFAVDEPVLGTVWSDQLRLVRIV